MSQPVPTHRHPRHYQAAFKLLEAAMIYQGLTLDQLRANDLNVLLFQSEASGNVGFVIPDGAWPSQVLTLEPGYQVKAKFLR